MVDNRNNKTSLAMYRTTECPKCGKRQHAAITSFDYNIFKLRCVYCGYKFEYRTLTAEERKQRNRESAKRFYYNNRELVNQRAKKWYQNNKDYRKQYMRKYHLKKKREQGKDKKIPFQCMRKPVAVCDKITMKVIKTYPSARDAGLYEGKNEVTIKSQCRNKATQKGKVVYRYVDEIDENESFDGNKYRPLKISDTETGKYYIYYTLEEVSKDYCIHKSAISSAVTNGKLMLGRYKVEYAR